MTTESKFNKLLVAAKNHPLFSFIIFIGFVVVCLATFTESIDIIWSIYEKRVERKNYNETISLPQAKNSSKKIIEEPKQRSQFENKLLPQNTTTEKQEVLIHEVNQPINNKKITASLPSIVIKLLGSNNVITFRAKKENIESESNKLMGSNSEREFLIPVGQKTKVKVLGSNNLIYVDSNIFSFITFEILGSQNNIKEKNI